jgi:uncharacterized protein (DUF1684 family)
MGQGAGARRNGWRAGLRSALVLAALAAVTAVDVGCGRRAAVVPYAERIAQIRFSKNEFLETAADSPVPPPRRTELLPLGYFPIDPSYSVPAVLTPFTGEPALEMPTSTGLRRQMRRAGTLRFSLKGHPLQLTTFVEADAPTMDRLFLPFGDLTNGTETYAAGRYLDLDRSSSGLYEIDFNLAYHPYCYYNPTYDCPYPPAENRLKLPVRAGERMKAAIIRDQEPPRARTEG